MPKMIEISAAEYERLQDCIREDGLRIAALTEENKALQQEAAMRTVDAAPMTHAKWLLRHVGHGHYWECSHCHQNPCIYVTEDTKFCPNCGAKMNGEGGAE